MAVLLGSSYLVGMELPGKRAVFRALDLEFGGAPVSVPFDYGMEVTRVSERGELSIAARLTADSRVVARADIAAAVIIRATPRRSSCGGRWRG
jgi:hypothetical protein